MEKDNVVHWANGQALCCSLPGLLSIMFPVSLLTLVEDLKQP